MKKNGFLFVGLGLAALLILAGIGVAVAWIRIEGLKAQLAANIGNALGAKVEVASLTLDFWKSEMRAGGITLTNNRPDAPWDHGEIAQATVRFHWRDFLAPVQPLAVDVDSWQLVLRPGAPLAGADATTSSPDSAPADTSAPPAARRGIEVTQLTAHNGDVEMDLAEGRQVMMHGVDFDAGKNGEGTWNTLLHLATISAGTLKAGPGSVTIKALADKIAFENLQLQCETGAITGSGDISRGGAHNASARLSFTDVPVTMLVAAPWQMKLSGLASGDLAYQGNEQLTEAQGGISVRQGKFNVLPFLGQLVQMVGLPDITGIELDRATAHFDWKDRALHLTQIDVRKNDVVRVSGDVDVDPMSQVDGRLKVGLPNAVASKWPALQTAVFTSQVDDYSWTDVHLTGTPDHLQEDLTSRLLATGLQSGGTLLNQGVQKASDLLKSFMGP